MRRRGFTLVELLISTAIGALLIVTAARFFTDHSRILRDTMTTADMYQDSRVAADLLLFDLKHAGAGVGYRPDGQFSGLMRGSFSTAAGASFQANNGPITLEAGQVITDDIGIRVAFGDRRTIAAYQGDQGEVCKGGAYKTGDVVLLLSQEGLHARSATLNSLVDTPCTVGQCTDGCERFTTSADNTYASDVDAQNADYLSGALFGEFAQVVWFVTPGPKAQGQLRKATITAASTCSARDETCGGVVADGIEALHMAVWQWDPVTSGWEDKTSAVQIDDRRRLRVDVELVARAPDGQRSARQAEARLTTEPNVCIPSPCGSSHTSPVPRQVLRASVELINSGRMQIR